MLHARRQTLSLDRWKMYLRHELVLWHLMSETDRRLRKDGALWLEL